MAQEQLIQRELQRQQLLGELGLTAWVVQKPLAGAISSPVLGVKPSAQRAAPSNVQQATEVPQQQPVAPSENPLTAVRQGLSGQAITEPITTPQTSKESPQIKAVPEKGEPVAFTLQAFAMKFGYLLVEQQDAKAPSFAREEQMLLKNIAALWGGWKDSPKVFSCPVGHQPMYQTEAQELLEGFVGGLEEQLEVANNKILILASTTVTDLLVDERYQVKQQRLGVSSLAEMLAEPLVHKPKSWQAMFEAEFYAPAKH